MIDDRLQVLREQSQVPARPLPRIMEAAAIQDHALVAMIDHLGQPHHLSMHACLCVHSLGVREEKLEFPLQCQSVRVCLYLSVYGHTHSPRTQHKKEELASTSRREGVS